MSLCLGTFWEEICTCVPVYIRKSGNFTKKLMFVSRIDWDWYEVCTEAFAGEILEFNSTVNL